MNGKRRSEIFSCRWGYTQRVFAENVTSFGFGRVFLIHLPFRKLLVFPPHLTSVETKAELLHDF